MRSRQFAVAVHKLRKGCGMTRMALARAADIDPSYITLIERDGYVPTPAVMEQIDAAFQGRATKRDRAMLWITGLRLPQRFLERPVILHALAHFLSLPAGQMNTEAHRISGLAPGAYPDDLRAIQEEAEERLRNSEGARIMAEGAAEA